MSTSFNRRNFFKASGAGALGLAGASILNLSSHVAAQQTAEHSQHAIDMPGFVGDVNHQANNFNPSDILSDFARGDRVSTLENGQTLREYDIFAGDKEIEVAPGIIYPALIIDVSRKKLIQRAVIECPARRRVACRGRSDRRRHRR